MNTRINQENPQRIESTAALESEGFRSAEPTKGLFKSLNLALLKLNAKQLTIAQIAQGICE